MEGHKPVLFRHVALRFFFLLAFLLRLVRLTRLKFASVGRGDKLLLVAIEMSLGFGL